MVEAEPNVTASSHARRLISSHSTGMESSTLRFKNVNFIVEQPTSMFSKEKTTKNILTDVSGTVKWGRKSTECCRLEVKSKRVDKYDGYGRNCFSSPLYVC